MRIELNGVACEMPPDVQRKLLDFVQSDLEQRYTRDMDGAMKALAKAFSRKILMDLEKRARKAGGDELAARFRPPKRADPNLFLANVIRDIGEEALKNVCLYISLAEDGESYIVSDLRAGRIEQAQGQIGRPLADTGHDGIGEDHFLETPEYPAFETVPEGALLRL